MGETTRPEPGLITPLVETRNGNKKWRKQGEEGGKLPFLRPIVAESDLEWIIQNDDATFGQLIPTSAQDFNTPTIVSVDDI